VLTVNGDEITLWHDDRRCRVRGLGKNLSHELMKVNLLVSRQEDFHADTLDLHQEQQRADFIKRAAEELSVKEDLIRKDVGWVFRKLEELRDEQVKKALTPAKPEVILSQDERAEALSLLKDPQLLERMRDDFAWVFPAGAFASGGNFQERAAARTRSVGTDRGRVCAAGIFSRRSGAERERVGAVGAAVGHPCRGRAIIQSQQSN
jgi:hypothetical protein